MQNKVPGPRIRVACVSDSQYPAGFPRAASACPPGLNLTTTTGDHDEPTQDQDDLLMVNAKMLTAAAEQMRTDKTPTRTIPGVGVEVSSAQLEAAAKLIGDADPSVCNGNVQECPGFIQRAHQADPKVLVLTIGILPATTHHIDRAGALLTAAGSHDA